MTIPKIIKAMKAGRPVYYINKSTRVIVKDQALYIRHLSGITAPLLNDQGALNYGSPKDYKHIK